MKSILIILLTIITSLGNAQSECMIAYVSDNYIENMTSDTLYVSVDNKNQKSFPTDGPTLFSIEPGGKQKVSSLEWAEEFKNPTIWYTFEINSNDTTIINDPKKWIFKQIDETTGEFTLTHK